MSERVETRGGAPAVVPAPGWARRLENTPWAFILPAVAYLFALSQFVMAWTLMALYVRRARRYDAMAETLLQNLKELR